MAKTDAQKAEDKKKKDLVKELTKEGLQLSGEETIEELEAKKAELEAKKNGGGMDTIQDNKENKTEKGFVFVFIKYPCYVSDEERVGAGLYKIKAEDVPERLKKAGKDACEIFEKSIDSISLVAVAKHFGVDPNNYRGEGGDVKLLASLVQEEMKKF